MGWFPLTTRKTENLFTIKIEGLYEHTPKLMKNQLTDI